jgi:hypothetical protein
MVAMFVPVCAATAFAFVWTATVLGSGWRAGALVSAGTATAFVSVCATAEKAVRMKTKRMLKFFMILPFCDFCRNSLNSRRTSAPEGNGLVNLTAPANKNHAPRSSLQAKRLLNRLS